MKKEHFIPARFFNTAMDPALRNPGLDVLRALCTIGVVVSHSNNLLGHYISYKFIFPVGPWAQEIFFSLSGFLIGGQILKLFEQQLTLRKLFTFYGRRSLRIVPFYYFFIVLNLCLFYFVYRRSSIEFLKADFNIWPYFFFLQNFSSPHPYFFPEIWPLPVEEWSYLLMPLPLIFAAFLFKGPSRTKYIITALSCIVVVNIMRINYVYDTGPELDWQLRKVTVYRLDALLYGLLMAVFIKEKPELLKRIQKGLFFGGMILGFFFTFASYKFNGPFISAVLFLFMPLSGALLIPFFRFQDFPASKINRFFTHISLVSYSVLLCHLYFLQFLFISILKPESFLQAIAATLTYLIALLFFSSIFYNFVERPVLLRRRSLE